ncbi:hypothetical protein L1887_50609 [Cichorium endivia]|nr:hypothetical protein L1887_50609 [Cichorium endivia]
MAAAAGGVQRRLATLSWIELASVPRSSPRCSTLPCLPQACCVLLLHRAPRSQPGTCPSLSRRYTSVVEANTLSHYHYPYPTFASTSSYHPAAHFSKAQPISHPDVSYTHRPQLHKLHVADDPFTVSPPAFILQPRIVESTLTTTSSST